MFVFFKKNNIPLCLCFILSILSSLYGINAQCAAGYYRGDPNYIQYASTYYFSTSRTIGTQSEHQVSPDECRNLCTAEPLCVGYTTSTTLYKCILGHTWPPDYYNSAFTSYQKDMDITYTEYASTRYFSASLTIGTQSEHQVSPDECRILCTNEPLCVGYVTSTTLYKCILGNTWPPDYYNSAFTAYQKDEMLCTACAEHATSPEASDDISDCTCNVGYSGALGGPCSACTTGTYKNAIGSAECTACAQHETSPDASVSADACVCMAGYGLSSAESSYIHLTTCGSTNYCDCRGTGYFGQITYTNSVEECKTWCNDNVDCSGFTLHGTTCYFRTGLTLSSLGERSSKIDSRTCYIKGESVAGGCSECAAGKYKYDTGDFDCTSCPDNFVDVNREYCICNAGYYLSGPETCLPCAVGSWKFGSGNATDGCTDCGDHMTTLSMESTGIESCLCNAGYYGNYDACQGCAAGTYTNTIGNTICTDCPVGSSSLTSTNDAESDCVADVGYEKNDGVYTECEIGFYKNTIENAPCTKCLRGSTTASTAATQNTQCECISPNYYGNAGEECLCSGGYARWHANDHDHATMRRLLSHEDCNLCEAGKYCPAETDSGGIQLLNSDTVSSCPANSNSPVGSSSQTDCICDAGYTGPDGGPCVQCGVGTYKDAAGSQGCTACAQHETSPMGSASLGACVCEAGYGYDGSTCTDCAPGSYKDVSGDLGCTSCAQHETSPEASVSADACVCVAGYASTSTYTYSVQSGHYCAQDYWGADQGPDPITIEECADHCSADENCLQFELEATNTDLYYCKLCSNSGTHAAAGWFVYVKDAEPSFVCSECIAGKYKDAAGNAVCTDCAQHETSPQGSVSADACVCVAGYGHEEGDPYKYWAKYFMFFRGTNGAWSNYMDQTIAFTTALQDCASDTTCDYVIVNICHQNYGCAGTARYRKGTATSGMAWSKYDNYVSILSPDTNDALLTQMCTNKHTGNDYDTTLQHSTWWNVYDTLGLLHTRQAGDYSVCDIAPGGQYYNVAPPLGGCASCDAGTFKTADADTACDNCPADATSPTGSDELTDCFCNAGYSGSNGGTCTVCPTDTYQDTPGSSTCEACPENSQSPQGSVVGDACLCNAGYQEVDDSVCTTCPNGKFKTSASHDQCSQCRSHSNTVDDASTLSSECLCNAGYYDNGGTCEQCASGTYKTGLGDEECTSCPGNSDSPQGSSLENQCICNAGYETSMSGASISCTACDPNFYGDSGACVDCPSNSQSAALSTSISDCKCNQGYTGPDGGGCVACGADKYKDSVGSSSCTSCEANMNSLAASTTSGACLCNAGFSRGVAGSGSSTSPCQPCEQNTYCPAENTVTATSVNVCPDNSNSPAGSDELTDCKCNMGYAGPDGQACQICDFNYYTDAIGSPSCLACPEYSTTTNQASTSIDLCECDQFYKRSGSGESTVCHRECGPGFEASDDESRCFGCRVSHYKPDYGDHDCTECPGVSYSLVQNQTALNSCICPQGYVWNGTWCHQCDDGKFNNRANQTACFNCTTSCDTYGGRRRLLTADSWIDLMSCGSVKHDNEVSSTITQGTIEERYDSSTESWHLPEGFWITQTGLQLAIVQDFAMFIRFKILRSVHTGHSAEFFVRITSPTDPDIAYMLYRFNPAGDGQTGRIKFRNANKQQAYAYDFDLPNDEWLKILVQWSSSDEKIRFHRECNDCSDSVFVTGPVPLSSGPFDIRIGGSETWDSDIRISHFYLTNQQVNMPTDDELTCAANTAVETASVESASHTTCPGLCRAPAGYRVNADGNNVELCPVNHYQDGSAANCTKCPSPETYSSEGGLTSVTECACRPGYTRVGDTCTACQTGKYKEEAGDASCITCDDNSDTYGEGSTSVSDCLCKADYEPLDYAHTIVDGVCQTTDVTMCHTCDKTSLQSCIDSVVALNAPYLYVFFAQDNICAYLLPTDGDTNIYLNPSVENCGGPGFYLHESQGYYGFYTAIKPEKGNLPHRCAACQQGQTKHVLSNEACIQCPAHSTLYQDKQHHANNCQCDPGYSGSGGNNPCVACAVGKFGVLHGNEMQCHDCPVHATTESAASKNESFCVCESSYEPSESGGPWDGHDCISSCGPGFTGTGSACEKCAVGSFKTQRGGESCTLCTGVRSSSRPGSISDTNCSCAAGKFGVDSSKFVIIESVGGWSESGVKIVSDFTQPSSTFSEFTYNLLEGEAYRSVVLRPGGLDLAVLDWQISVNIDNLVLFSCTFKDCPEEKEVLLWGFEGVLKVSGYVQQNGNLQLYTRKTLTLQSSYPFWNDQLQAQAENLVARKRNRAGDYLFISQDVFSDSECVNCPPKLNCKEFI